MNTTQLQIQGLRRVELELLRYKRPTFLEILLGARELEVMRVHT